MLPRAETRFPAIQFRDRGRTFDLYDYLALNRVAGLLVLKNGKIALEVYELGMQPETRWLGFSMAKSITSTLVGAAIRDGYIRSIDDPVTRCVPVLKGSAYDGVRVRDVLTMTSGVAWRETYTDPGSDRRRLLARQRTLSPGVVLRYVRGLKRAAAPGMRWNYSTGESYVLGAVVEGAVGKPLAEYLTQTIWARAGMERDATWWVESPQGAGSGGSGIGATLRDYGRLALIAQNGGSAGGAAIVPRGWFTQAGVGRRIGGEQIDYGYGWWIPGGNDPIHAGAFEAAGIFGQFMYVNPRERLSIVVLSARSKPDSPDVQVDDNVFFAAVARALRRANVYTSGP